MAKLSAEDIIKAENATAAEWLLNYHQRLKEYQEDCERFNILAGTICDDMPHGSDTSDPTSKKAVALAKLHEQRDWLDVIEYAESTLSEKKRMFLKFRRLAMDIKMDVKYKKEVGRPGFNIYVAVRYSEWFMRRYNAYVMPSDRVMLQWWDIIVNVVARLATKKGLFP